MPNYEITDDFILNLEFQHDNKDAKLYDNMKLLDMINNKLFKLNYLITKEPESILKDLLFKEICYNKICFNNIKFQKNNLDQSDNYIVVYDNMQFDKKNLELTERLLGKKFKVFIPFIYLAETLITTKNMTINKKIENIKIMYPEYELIFDNYYDNDGNILLYYKNLMDDIGMTQINGTYRIINYKIYNKDYNKETFILQLEIIYSYLKNYTKYSDNNLFFLLYLNPIYKKISDLLDNEINPDYSIISDEKLKMLYDDDNLKVLFMSLKEARDTYYIKEILKHKEIKTNYNYIYITKDEISNIRCVINKISTINLLEHKPRYFCFIHNNMLFMKLFDIFHIYTDNTYDLYKHTQKINSENIFKYSKSIITKIIGGGILKNIERNININKLNIKTLKYLKMDSNIEKDLYNIFESFRELHYYIFYKLGTMSLISYGKKENDIMNNIFKIKNTFNKLIEIYKKNVINNDIISFLNSLNFSNYESLYNLENRFKLFLISVQKNFINKYFEYFNTDNRIIYNSYEALFIVWLIDYYLNFDNRQRDLEIYKYLFPEYFTKYEIIKLLKILNINKAISEHKKKMIDLYETENPEDVEFIDNYD